MKSKNIHIQGLRGIAIILVVVYHFFCRYQQLYIDNVNPPFIISTFGVLGVSLFLLISGYYIKISSQNVSVLNLLKKRFSRIWPPYFVAITVIYIITKFFVLPNRTVSFFDYILNIPFFNGFLGLPYVDGAHWYLTTLISGIIILMLIQKCKPQKQQIFLVIWLILLIILALLVNVKFGGVLKSIFNFLFLCFGGSYMPYMIIGFTIHFIKKNNIFVLLVFALSLVETYITLGIISCFIMFVSFLAVIYSLRECGIFLKLKPIVFIGTVSYSVYLIHQNIGYLILNKFVEIFGAYQLWMSFAVTVITIFLGIVFYYIVEKPCGKLFCVREKKVEKD